MTTTPYPISGYVYSTDGSTALVNALVGARNLTTGEYLPAGSQAVSNSSGEYSIDIANFSSGYTNGDIIEILVYAPAGYYAIESTIANTSTGSEEKNITTTAITYATPAGVSALLGGIKFDMISMPTLAHVASMIVESEGDLNRDTDHSWKEVTITEELPDILDHYHQGGRPVYLRHMSIKDFTSGTDKIEVWDGSSWTDWVATKTEGRADDFWVDYNKGIVFLNNLTYEPQVRDKVRVTYRYGDDTVPADIKKACEMYTAIKLVTGDDRSNILPEGGDNLNYRDKIETWRKYIEEVTAARAKITPGGGGMGGI